MSSQLCTCNHLYLVDRKGDDAIEVYLMLDCILNYQLLIATRILQAKSLFKYQYPQIVKYLKLVYLQVYLDLGKGSFSYYNNLVLNLQMEYFALDKDANLGNSESLKI